MFSANMKMLSEIQSLNWSTELTDPALNEIAEGGFVESDGYLFLKKCRGMETNVTVENFPDKSGYESFVNSIHIDDHVDDCWLEYGFSLIRGIFDQYQKLGHGKPLACITPMDDQSLTLKFHILRHGEQILAEDLERYEEAVMCVSSDYPMSNFISDMK